MIVLGIDPGSLVTGYGVVRGEGAKAVCLDYGTIRIHGKTTLPKRLDIIYHNLIRVAQVHRPEAAAIESLFYSKNVKSALVIGEARGVVLLACEQLGLPVFEYAPATVKQAVVGQGGAAKGQVGYMIQRLLGLSDAPPEDAADALAIALCHLHRARWPGTLKGKQPSRRETLGA
jgi:crossover junction endodeoxyribonuclease RuvC